MVSGQCLVLFSYAVFRRVMVALMKSYHRTENNARSGIGYRKVCVFGADRPTIDVILSEAKNLVTRAASCLWPLASALPQTNTRGARFFAALRMTWGSGFAYLWQTISVALALHKLWATGH